MVEQPVGAAQDQRVDVFEAAVIVGIGHFTCGHVVGVIEEARQHSLRMSRCHAPQISQILVIHRQDVIKRVKIGGRNLPGAARVGDAVLLQHAARAPVGWLADVVTAGACRVNSDGVAQPSLVHALLEDGFGHRRAADIAQADEKYAHSHRIDPPDQYKNGISLWTRAR